MSIDIAVFGGGCFWCLETVFDMLRGVNKVESGYSAGDTDNPDYASICRGDTGHAEVVKIEFDPGIISYRKLLEIFFSVHDPTTINRQGNDIGTQYRSIILSTSKEQDKIARDYVEKLKGKKAYPDRIVTTIEPLGKFYRAEDYHQHYFASNTRAPYCNAVISPKIDSVKAKFKDILK